jgi:hypothetical protein
VICILLYSIHKKDTNTTLKRERERREGKING